METVKGDDGKWPDLIWFSYKQFQQVLKQFLLAATPRFPILINGWKTFALHQSIRKAIARFVHMVLAGAA